MIRLSGKKQKALLFKMSMEIFYDLTAGFGVAAVGHRNPKVVAAHNQLDILIHVWEMPLQILQNRTS